MWRFLPTFVRNPLRALPQRIYDEPIVPGRTARAPIAWVTAPVLIERILLHEHQRFPKPPLEKRVLGRALGDGILTAQGSSWRWQRRVASPLFRKQDLLRLLPQMMAAADTQIERWRGLPAGRVTALERDMTDATYDVVTRTLFAGAAAEEGDGIKAASEELLGAVTWDIAAGMLRAPEWIWHPGRARLRRNATRLRRIVGAIVARRRRENGEDPSLVGRMLAATDPETGRPMTDEQVIDNLLTFLLAGHETTAKALTWTLYLLARAPDWQDRVRAEILQVAGSGAIRAEHLDTFPITTRVLKEAMRLYPPAPVLTRLAGEDVELGGYRIMAGTVLVLPIYAIHRHRKLWTDPDRFDPDRFLPEREATYTRTQFMPFGFGPRTCIGMSFAMIEATALLAAFVRAAHFGWDGHTMPEPVSRITLRPRGGMPLTVTVH
jgi:cytochrome P450